MLYELGCDDFVPFLNLLSVNARENRGELWFSRPSELVSPRRDQ